MCGVCMGLSTVPHDCKLRCLADELMMLVSSAHCHDWPTAHTLHDPPVCSVSCTVVRAIGAALCNVCHAAVVQEQPAYSFKSHQVMTDMARLTQPRAFQES